MKFRTKLLQGSKTATGFEVPTKVVEALGAGKRPPVRVTIKGYIYRNTVAVMGGKFMIGVSAEHRAGAGVAGGEMIDIDLKLDDAPREVIVPADFAKAMKNEPKARKFFDGLAYSHRKEHVRAIEDAKTPETRERRISKAMAMLRAGKK